MAKPDDWTRRATDIVTNTQPPLKHLFQNLFNMTVDGPNFLGRLHDAGMQILLRPDEDGRSLLPVLPHFLKQLHFPIRIGYTALFPVNLSKLKMR